MENRTITIVGGGITGKKTVITDATTFGELKTAASAQGVTGVNDYEWMEGITKTRPLSDDSVLPTNVTFKGQVTNDLVYMLSIPNKKIMSGMDRKEMCAYIKEHNLQDIIRTAEGVHSYLNCSNDVLAKYVGTKKSVKKVNIKKASTKVEEPAVVATKYAPETTGKEADYKALYEELVKKVAAFMYNIKTSSENILKDLDIAIEDLETEATKNTASSVDFSEDDLKNMFN